MVLGPCPVPAVVAATPGVPPDPAPAGSGRRTLSGGSSAAHRRAMTSAPSTSPPVVVGVDGSASSRDAVRWAARAAALRHAPLVLVTTRAELFTLVGAGAPAAWLDVQDDTARVHLDDAARTATDTADVAVSTVLDPGTAAGALLAHSRTARLLVVGSRGLGELTGGLVGSVSTAVVSHAQCPVVVVRGLPPADEPALTGPVVVGVDATPTSVPAVAAAFEEAALRGAELVAVHAWTELDLATVYALDSPHRRLDADELARGQELLLAEALAGWQERYPDVTVTRVVVADRPVAHLLDRAEGAQLVVVGTHGRSGLASMLLGSTSRALLHATPCPLMVVRPTATR